MAVTRNTTNMYPNIIEWVKLILIIIIDTEQDHNLQDTAKQVVDGIIIIIIVVEVEVDMIVNLKHIHLEIENMKLLYIFTNVKSVLNLTKKVRRARQLKPSRTAQTK